MDIDVNRNTNINNNIDRSKYRNKVTSGQGGKGEWQHNPEHRKGASYRDQGTAQKYDKASTREATQSRESFRGRGEASTQDLGRGGADQSKAKGGQGGQPGAGDRAGGDTFSRQSAQQGGRDGAFGGGQSGSEVKQQSSRGSSSRNTLPPRTSGGGGGGGGGRGGGGGGRR